MGEKEEEVMRATVGAPGAAAWGRAAHTFAYGSVILQHLHILIQQLYSVQRGCPQTSQLHAHAPLQGGQTDGAGLVWLLTGLTPQVHDWCGHLTSPFAPRAPLPGGSK